MCANTQNTQFTYGPISIPGEFTIQIWLKHMPCSDPSSSIRTIFFKQSHINWIYNTSINGYSLTIQNPARIHRINNNLMPAVVYNKWIHLSVINSASKGFYLLKYGSEIVLRDSFVDIINNNQDFVHIGTSGIPAFDRFDGYFREFRVWKRSILLSEAKDNYDRMLSSCIDNTDLLSYFSMIPFKYPDNKLAMTEKSSGMKTIGNLFDSEWTDGNVPCDANTDHKFYFDGVSCTSILKEFI